MEHFDRQELTAIRARLDKLDREMVRLLAERRRLVGEVIEFKREHSMGVVDRRREQEMLQRIEVEAASSGLEPRVARAVLLAVIEAFTEIELEQVHGERDAEPPQSAASTSSPPNPPSRREGSEPSG